MINFFKCLTLVCKVLDSRAVALKSNLNHCLCLTSSGHIYVWKLSQESSSQDKSSYVSSSSSLSSISTINSKTNSNKFLNDDLNYQNITAIINHESCQFILKNGEWLDCEITETGVPILCMSKNRSYFFSLKTKSWHLLPCLGTMTGEESQLLLNSNTIYTSSKSNTNSVLNGPLMQIQSRNKNSSILKTIETLNKTNANHLFNKQDFTLTHLESQVNASIGLNSAKEYKFWLMTLVRYLVENNYEEKLTEICNFLLGPLYSTNWNHTFLTFNKRDLLKEVILIVAENLNLQRLYSFYKQQLNLINNLSSKNNVLDRLISSNSRTAISFSKMSESNSSKELEKPLAVVEEVSKTSFFDNQVEMQIENEEAPRATSISDLNVNETNVKIMDTLIVSKEEIFKMPDIPVQPETSNLPPLKNEIDLNLKDQKDETNSNNETSSASDVAHSLQTVLTADSLISTTISL